MSNVEQVVKEGYRFLMAAPARTFPAAQKARQLIGRA
jgi:hypothetical protein